MRYSSLRKHLTEDGKAVSPTTCYTHDRCVQFPSFTKDAAINMMKGKTVLFLGDSTMNQQHRYLLDMLGLLGTSHEAQEKTGGACHTPNQLHSVVVACNNDVLGDVALKDLGDKPITTPLTLESGLISSSMTHAMECVDGLWVDSQTNNNALFPHEPSLATNFFNPPDTPTPPCSKFKLECRYTSSPMDTTICFYEARHLNPDAWQIEALTSKLGIQKVDLIYFGAGAHFLHRGGTDSGTNYFAWPGNHGARGQPLDSYVHHGERMKAFIVRMFESGISENFLLAEPNAGCDEDWGPPRSDVRDELMDAASRDERLNQIVEDANSFGGGVEVFSKLDAWNSYDGRDGMRLLVSEQRRFVVEALDGVKVEQVNFMSVDFRNLLREHCDATSDGIHYALDNIFGNLFYPAMRMMMEGCVGGCEWVQTVDY